LNGISLLAIGNAIGTDSLHIDMYDNEGSLVEVYIANNKELWKSVHKALQNNQWKKIASLLQKHPKLSLNALVTDDQGNTVLHSSVLSAEISVVKNISQILSSKSFTLMWKIQNSEQRTPLNIAKEKYPGIADFLIRQMDQIILEESNPVLDGKQQQGSENEINQLQETLDRERMQWQQQQKQMKN